MIEVACFLLLAAVLFFLFYCMFSSEKVSKKVGNQFLVFIAVIFVVFSLFFHPKDFIRWDLLEHFKLLDEMRVGGIKFAAKESQYADLFIYNWFAYLISLLPQTMQNLITAIPLIIDFVIFGYVYKQTYNVHLPETNGKTRILSIVLWLFTFGIKLAISGIRCSLAVSIAFLAIYLEMIQKNKKILSILLYLTSIFIHNFAIVVIFVRLLTKIKKPALIMLISLTFSFLLEPLSRYIVDNVDNEYLVFSFGRVLDTVEDMDFTSAISTFSGSTLMIYLCFVVLSVYLFVISMKSKQALADNSYCSLVANFSAVVGAVAIGLSFNYLYLERFMYLLSYALFMMVSLRNRRKNGINEENLWLVPLALFVFFFNDIYIYMVNYVGYYFLAS